MINTCQKLKYIRNPALVFAAMFLATVLLASQCFAEPIVSENTVEKDKEIARQEVKGGTVILAANSSTLKINLKRNGKCAWVARGTHSHVGKKTERSRLAKNCKDACYQCLQ